MFSYFSVTYLASNLHFVGGQRKQVSDTGSSSTFQTSTYILGMIIYVVVSAWGWYLGPRSMSS